MNNRLSGRTWAAVPIVTAFLWSLLVGMKVFEFQGPVGSGETPYRGRASRCPPAGGEFRGLPVSTSVIR